MGVITTALFFQYMKQYQSAAVTQENTEKVVVVKDPIAKNERISSSKLETVDVPENSEHPQSIKTIEELEGKIATSDLIKGETILSHRVVSENTEEVYVSRKVRDGYRAVSVGVNLNQSVSNLIEPEDEVDVIFSKIIKEVNQEPRVESTIIIEKARVLAVGRKILAPEDSEVPYAEYSNVTLELTPDSALKLVNSAEQGSIHFILHQRPIQKQKQSEES